MLLTALVLVSTMLLSGCLEQTGEVGSEPLTGETVMKMELEEYRS